jgi:hypothetical protein
MAEVHWNAKKMETFPSATVPGTQHDVDFMVKDSKRLADSGGLRFHGLRAQVRTAYLLQRPWG